MFGGTTTRQQQRCREQRKHCFLSGPSELVVSRDALCAFETYRRRIARSTSLASVIITGFVWDGGCVGNYGRWYTHYISRRALMHLIGGQEEEEEKEEEEEEEESEEGPFGHGPLLM